MRPNPAKPANTPDLVNPDPEQLRAWFSELRHEDERLAPPFERDWREALRRKHTGAARPAPGRGLVAAALFLAASAAVALCATLFVHRAPRSPLAGADRLGTAATRPAPRPGPRLVPLPVGTRVDLETPGAGGSVADWQSPTAFLMDQADDEAAPPAAGDRAADPIGIGYENF